MDCKKENIQSNVTRRLQNETFHSAADLKSYRHFHLSEAKVTYTFSLVQLGLQFCEKSTSNGLQKSGSIEPKNMFELFHNFNANRPENTQKKQV